MLPEAATQVCVVHQIRNSCRYVTYKDLKAFTQDLITIYGAVNKDAAALALDEFEQKWGKKYTKTKLSFPNDEAVKKSVYLAIGEIEKKWTIPIRNWAIVINQFILIFEDRILW